MWWTCVVLERHQHPEHGMMLGSFDADRIGKKGAKKAAKALGREYIRAGGPGQPRLIESPLIMAGSTDMTWTVTGEVPQATEDASAPPANPSFGWSRSGVEDHPASEEQLLAELLDGVLADEKRQAPALFVERVRPMAVDLQSKGVSVERQMVATFKNVRVNRETQDLSDEELWQVVAAVYAQLIREGSLRR